jgi:O-antigen ligase
MRASLATPVASVTAVGLGSLCAAWLVTHGYGATRALTFVLLPAVCVLLSRPDFALLAATALAVVAPRSVAHVWFVPSFLAVVAIIVRTKPFRRLRKLDVAFVAWLIWLLISWRLHPELGITSKSLIQAVLPVLFYAWIRLSLHYGVVPRLLWTLLVAGAVGAGTIWLEWIHGRVLFSDPSHYQWSGGGGEIYRPGGVFGGAPAAAIGLAMISLATLALVRTGRWAVVCQGLIWSAIVVTYSRAGWIGLAAGLVTYALLSPYRHWLRAAYLLAIFTVAAAAARGVVVQSQVYQSGVVRPSSTSGRLEFLHLTLPLTTDSRSHFLFGRGFDAFETTQGLDSHVMDSPVLVERGGPHNEYLRAVLEQGAVGLTLLLAWLGGSIAAGIGLARSLPRASDERLVISGLTAAAVAFACAGLFHDLSHNVPDLTIAAVVLGALASFPSRRFFEARGYLGGEFERSPVRPTARTGAVTTVMEG